MRRLMTRKKRAVRPSQTHRTPTRPWVSLENTFSTKFPSTIFLPLNSTFSTAIALTRLPPHLHSTVPQQITRSRQGPGRPPLSRPAEPYANDNKFCVDSRADIQLQDLLSHMHGKKARQHTDFHKLSSSNHSEARTARSQPLHGGDSTQTDFHKLGSSNHSEARTASNQRLHGLTRVRPKSPLG